MLAIFSGQRLDVDPERSLVGECDFILALTDPVPRLRAPIVTVVEAKKSRTSSYSETRFASAPVLPWRAASGRFMIFSKSFWLSFASSVRPISSIRRARANRKVKSKPSAIATPSARTQSVGIALFGMTR